MVRRVAVVIGLAGALLYGFSSGAVAQDGTKDQIQVADLAAWLENGDWAEGGLFAAMGLIGALVTTFGLIGGAVPGTAGKAKIDADSERLDRMSQRLDQLIHATPPDSSAISAIETSVNSLRDDLQAERRQQYVIASVLYAILGAAFAALLAKDILQALLIGAGWTAVLGSFGLKRDYAERKAIKDEALESSLATANAMAVSQPVLPTDPGLQSLQREVAVAQSI